MTVSSIVPDISAIFSPFTNMYTSPLVLCGESGARCERDGELIVSSNQKAVADLCGPPLLFSTLFFKRAQGEER